MEDLSSDLLHFEARKAECFCCSNGHCHPTTNQRPGGNDEFNWSDGREEQEEMFVTKVFSIY